MIFTTSNGDVDIDWTQVWLTHRLCTRHWFSNPSTDQFLSLFVHRIEQSLQQRNLNTYARTLSKSKSLATATDTCWIFFQPLFLFSGVAVGREFCAAGSAGHSKKKTSWRKRTVVGLLNFLGKSETIILMTDSRWCVNRYARTERYLSKYITSQLHYWEMHVI